MSVGADHPASARNGAWKSRAYAVEFWTLAVLGVPVMIVAWFLLPLASLEETTEQSKALAAGSTMEGTTFLFGVLPLVLAHVIGFALLCSAGAFGSVDRGRGALRGAVAVVLASFIGFFVVSILTGGELVYDTPEFVP